MSNTILKGAEEKSAYLDGHLDSRIYWKCGIDSVHQMGQNRECSSFSVYIKMLHMFYKLLGERAVLLPVISTSQ